MKPKRLKEFLIAPRTLYRKLRARTVRPTERKFDGEREFANRVIRILSDSDDASAEDCEKLHEILASWLERRRPKRGRPPVQIPVDEIKRELKGN